jgi:uncharacterized protein YndB with AHSA1/START domain
VIAGANSIGGERRVVPHFSETIDIARPPDDVWRAIDTPERWFSGYLETRSRSEGYPGPGTRDNHVYHTRRDEGVAAQVTRSEAPSVLEEDQEGQSFKAWESSPPAPRSASSWPG